MEVLGRYILSVTSAAILYSILQSLLDKKSSTAALLKLIGGLFLTFSVLLPITHIDFDSIFDTSWDYTLQADSLTEQGKQLTQDRLCEFIKTRTEAYILDKAMSYQTPMRVNVTLSHGETPVPTAVWLQGSISPYTKSVMQDWLQKEMGIPKENQVWTD